MKKILKIAIVSTVILSSLGLNNYIVDKHKVNALPRHNELHLRDGPYSLLLKRDGTVWGWGDNASGQLGNGTVTSFEQNMVQASGLTNVVKITGGKSTSIALKEDGTVWGWGSNGQNNIGDGTAIARTIPVQTLGENGVGFLTDVVDISSAVSASGSFVLALKKDGTVVGWGLNIYGVFDGSSTRTVPKKILNLSNVVKISAGLNHALVLKEDGTVWSIGGNQYGELGTGDTLSSNIPKQVLNLSNIKDIKTGFYNSFALKEDGTVWSWGRNSNGELGDGSISSKYQPSQISGLNNVLRLSIGYSTAIALNEAGEVWTWGDNAFGQVGNGNKIDQTTPVKISISGVVEVASGISHSLIMKANGEIWGWGQNNKKQLGDRPEAESLVPVQLFIPPPPVTSPLFDIKQISSFSNFAIAVKNDGTVWTWGNNSDGQLGDGTTVSRNKAKQINLTNVKEVAAGGGHALAVKNDGTLWVWGLNNYGQLGDGTLISKSVPTLITGIVPIMTVAAGENHSVAISSFASQAYGWGLNANGQIGDNTLVNKSIPTMVIQGGMGLTGPIQIVAGKNFSAATNDNLEVWVWGANESGQIGDGTTTQKRVPTQTIAVSGLSPLIEVYQIEAGNSHIIARKGDGTLVSWGLNNYGQLGIGTKINKSRPVVIPGLTGITEISAKNGHSIVRKSDSTAWVWGLNEFGQLGLGNSGLGTERVSPTKVTAVTNVKNIEAGKNSSMFIHTDDKGSSVGANPNGELTDGTFTTRLVPISMIQESGMIEPIMSNIPYFKMFKTINTVLNRVELSLQQYNVVDGSGKRFKLSSGNKTLDYYITQGTDIISSVINITQNGMYAIYLKDDRGFEWKETILVNDIISDTAPVLNTVNKEYLVPFISKNAANININYTHQEPTQTTALELTHNAVSYSSVQEVTPEGTNLNKIYNMDLTGIAEINQILNVTFKLKDQNNFLSTEQSNVIEIYDPNVILNSTINTIAIDWTLSKLTNVEYILKRDGIEIYRGLGNSFLDTSVGQNVNYTYTLETVHNGITNLVYTGNKLSGNYTFQTFGDIELETKEISVNSVSQGTISTSNTTSLIQTTDIEKEFTIKMTMSPFTSINGGNISAENFKIENALIKDVNNNIIEIKDIIFTDNVASILISNADSSIDKKMKLEVLINNFKLNIPTKLKLNELSNEGFTSNIVYGIEWSP
jgi:alpha-tubulin suppressor-like RCC1 family protein